MAASEPGLALAVADDSNDPLMRDPDQHPPREPRRSLSSSPRSPTSPPARLSFSSRRSSQRGADHGLGISSKLLMGGMARKTLGILLLLVTVVLWTASSFLASVSGAQRLPRTDADC